MASLNKLFVFQTHQQHLNKFLSSPWEDFSSFESSGIKLDQHGSTATPVRLNLGGQAGADVALSVSTC